MRKLLLLTSIELFLLFDLKAQQDIRISGKVFVSYKMAARINTQQVKVSKKYISDFKVLAIKKTGTTNITEITNNKKSFCANDQNLFRRFGVRVAYSNNDGYFEIKGLQPQTGYILIYCDHDIQISEVMTGSVSATYSIGERSIRL
jgi:hypothetical protein